MENYQEYHQLQQQQNYRLDKDMLMDKTKQKREYYLNYNNNTITFTTVLFKRNKSQVDKQQRRTFIAIS